MASCGRMAASADEKKLLKAAKDGDAETLTALLQKGVYPNVHEVWRFVKREREDFDENFSREREFRENFEERARIS